MRHAKTLIGRCSLLKRLDAFSFPTHWALHHVAMYKSLEMFAGHKSCLNINYKRLL